MDGQPRSSRVVPTGRVHKKNVGELRQTAYGPLEYGAYPKGKQARLVGRASRPDRYVMRTQSAPTHQGGGSPRRIADGPAAAVSTSKADEASTDR